MKKLNELQEFANQYPELTFKDIIYAPTMRPIWLGMRIEAWKKYDCKCADCDKPISLIELSIHHKVPVRMSKQFWFEPSNLLPLCLECHSKVEGFRVIGHPKAIWPTVPAKKATPQFGRRSLKQFPPITVLTLNQPIQHYEEPKIAKKHKGENKGIKELKVKLDLFRHIS